MIDRKVLSVVADVISAVSEIDMSALTQEAPSPSADLGRPSVNVHILQDALIELSASIQCLADAINNTVNVNAATTTPKMPTRDHLIIPPLSQKKRNSDAARKR